MRNSKHSNSGYVVSSHKAQALAEKVLAVLAECQPLSACRNAITGYEAGAVLQKIESVNQQIARMRYGKPA